jgi:hypothetical protein
MWALLIFAVVVTCLAPQAAAQIPMQCYNQCYVNYGRCPNVTQCQGAQEQCLSSCALEAGLPPRGPAKPPPGGYGADALSSDGTILGHAKNWDTAEGARSGAVKSCAKSGHEGCRALYHYRHQCVALAWSRSGRMTSNGSCFVAGAQVASAAKSDALAACSAAGFKDCYLRSFSCSGRAW